ncbi:hypothetical protein KIS4809_2145 [Bacillus sp. ZZV12-4809]|nr:hypothetical protein KIS4809_2145 [Bacillus sp. ZZV12-4809]
MSSEEIILSWKNPESRQKVENHPSGTSFNELEFDEMLSVCGGSGDIKPEATPTIALTSALVSAPASFVGSYLVTKVFCK